MSALAHYLEGNGLATVIIALVREHAETMRPPRALWVPYELGRPFGEPGNPELQRQILGEALSLLDRAQSQPQLADFAAPAGFGEPDPDWRFPGELSDDDLRAEVDSLLPVWQRARDRLQRSTYGISGLSLEDACEYVARLLTDTPMNNPRGMGAIPRARFAIDDIKAAYLEAALADGGRPSSVQLLDWFWETTQAGNMIRHFQHAARQSDGPLKQIAGSLVPAERSIAFRGDKPDRD